MGRCLGLPTRPTDVTFRSLAHSICSVGLPGLLAASRVKPRAALPICQESAAEAACTVRLGNVRKVFIKLLASTQVGLPVVEERGLDMCGSERDV